MEENNTQFPVPLLFVVFNRPDTTKRVFDAIRNIRPRKLYIAADGPREHKDGEAGLCEETRKVVENIDWPCEVLRKYSDKNLGCKVGVSSSITWFFEHEEEGIILEDDCLPDPSFFTYCQELLEKYRNIPQVKMISGDNFQFGKTYGEASYYFSYFPHIWGWATWRRSWKEYDLEMKSYPIFKENNSIAKIFKDKKLQQYWTSYFDKLYEGKIDTWDGQVAYSMYDHGGVAIIPNVNLVSNIGFSENATHTKNADTIVSNMSVGSIKTITHPSDIIVNEEADIRYSKTLVKSIVVRTLSKIKSILH
jgi:hypothetical protein